VLEEGTAAVIYEPKRIRCARVQCPKCNNWFKADDINEDEYFDYTYREFNHNVYKCPIDGTRFHIPDDNIKETNELPKALVRKSTWELEENNFKGDEIMYEQSCI